MTTERAQMGGRRPYRLRCAECSETAALPAYECASCAGPLIVDAAPLTRGDIEIAAETSGIWRWPSLLPRTQHSFTLGEGSTQLLSLPSGGSRDMPEVRLFGKLESLNPTLSFKDRGMALAASVAADLGLEGLSLASTGNAAVSAAAYAATAGLRCRVVCGAASQASIKLAAASRYGADVEVVDGSYSDAYATARAAEADGWFNVTTTYRNPVLAEGYRGMALEIYYQLHGTVPDVVVVPVGAGPLLRSLLLGFADLRDAGLTDAVPRLVGVQAEACAPLARAWVSPDWLETLLQPLELAPTAAGAIADSLRGYEREGLLTLQAAQDSGGSIVAVSEADINAAAGWLARRGVLVEPAAAATLAAVQQPLIGEHLEPGASVVLLLTGHGIKEPMPHTNDWVRTES